MGLYGQPVAVYRGKLAWTFPRSLVVISADATARVTAVSVNAPDGVVWGQLEEARQCQMYLPSDVVFVQSKLNDVVEYKSSVGLIDLTAGRLSCILYIVG